jgi:drug/metabolite transporter (DMT)-like permease
LRKNLIAYLELTLAMAIVGSSVVVGKLLIASFPVFLGAGLRFAIASIILLPILIVNENGIPHITRTDWLFLFLQTLTGVFLFSVFLLYGLKFTTAAESGIITSTTPAVLGLISFLFLKERLTWNKGIGITFSLFGILAINLISTGTMSERGNDPLLGNLLVFGAVIGEALFTIFRKVASERVTPLAGATLMSILGFLMFLPFAIFEARVFDFSRATIADWFPVVYYGIVVTVIAFTLWFRGLSKVPASTAAVFTGVWPVSAVLLSYLILKEQFVVSHLLGIVCVLLGILLIARDPLQMRDKQATTSGGM